MSEATKKRLAQALFVEDSASEIRLITKLLNDARVQFEGHWVNCGEDALGFLSHDKGFEAAPRPDIIFLDLHLPQIKGGGILQKIQNDPGLSGIPVVVLSGSDFEDDVVSARELGAAHYLIKPLDHSKLCETVALIDTLKLEPEGEDWHLLVV